jgi:predicted nucleotidyltransferase
LGDKGIAAMSGLGFLRHLHPQKVSQTERLARIDKTCSAIVAVLNPTRVYIFGSATSGVNFDGESDIDCLAVVESDAQAATSWKLFGKIRKQISWPLDLICLSETEFQRKQNLGGVAFIATHEGRLLYQRN